ncbi:hypothetical protein Rhow_003112 [Rhodococcus wratislaviensis]|uniref:Uncharacterized protein n=1 Tax=Rhodococcus wratislaviensis TaxID=44752 RepID=A0A402C7P2_RHOWR|nr:hypothetical protein Rhow_003112 [Rhodococcus wratislaviensis]
MVSGEDVRDLLGMRTRAAHLMVGFYGAACSLLAVSMLTSVSHGWPVVLASSLCTAGAIALVSAGGDPLPARYTAALTMIGPVSSALVLAVVPVPVANTLQMWPFGAATAIYTFMCVRGRTLCAWIGLTATVTTAAVWASLTGQGAGYGISVSVINIAPLLMSTVFAFTIRPLGKAIFTLRQQSTQRAATEAAASAILEERDAQLDRLDELARPLLERIASGTELSADELLACRLLEAHLRDGLRAPGLTDGITAAAARAARTRGVEVVMLDDRGMVNADAAVGRRLRAEVGGHLDGIVAGTVTVRVMPPGRSILATILVNDGDDVRRLEFDHEGRRIMHVPVDATDSRV